MGNNQRKSRPESSEIKNLKLWKTFYTLTLFIGIILLLWEIHIYRKTLIDLYIPLLLKVIPGVIAYLLIRDHYRRTYIIDGVFFPLGQSVLSVGFITCFMFMAANYYLADSKNTKTQQFWIKEKATIQGRRTKPQPMIIIEYNGKDHELIFPSNYVKDALASSKVELILKPGFFGFDVIEKQGLISEFEGR